MMKRLLTSFLPASLLMFQRNLTKQIIMEIAFYLSAVLVHPMLTPMTRDIAISRGC